MCTSVYVHGSSVIFVGLLYLLTSGSIRDTVCTHTLCDKARKRVWTQDVELTLGQHESSLSHREAAIIQQAATWIHSGDSADTVCGKEDTGCINKTHPLLTD